MKCFYHNDRDAVGTCRACSRGLCPECAADFESAIGCVGRHVALAARIATSQARASAAVQLLPFYLFVSGLIFGAWGLLAQPFSFFLIIVGLGFVIFGILVLIRGRSATANS